jgi:hypothetical protein
MEPAKVLSEIARAFPVEPLPAITLRQGQLTDQGMGRSISEEEWEAEGRRDRGVPWPQIEDSALEECDAALSHLDNEDFIYYLPAFLAYLVRDIAAGRRDVGGLAGYVIFAITDQSNYSLSRVKKLSDTQIGAVINVLRFVRDSGGLYVAEANEALSRYWETPDAWRRTLIYAP